MSSLPEPIKVSPLIRLTRWSLLIAGIFYGYSRQSFLAKREKHIRAEEAKRKIIRDAKLKEQRRIASERDIEDISRMFSATSSDEGNAKGRCGRRK
ncbi:atp synthase e chain mitochondrial [Holotrichia oblita]|uniref:Atp synthase e chain mitochondrial n=1 Tax=Holotrichia oblita TaxID=644536 RepID=A0ACB9T0T9_HOLOL|nr:atp synthase e chain mitochondrial [Holotrichia oblita]